MLLSFVQVHSSSQADEAQGTRAQMTFVRSMMKQYGYLGLKVILIAGNDSNHPITEETFVNFMNDQELDHIYFLRGREGKSVAGLYRVSMLPTTFLIDEGGRISQRWNNVVLTGQMALAIESEIGEKEAWQNQAELIFPGLPGARKLSANIWLVDGGKPWRHHDVQPFRLLLFGEGSGDVRLDVFKEGDSSLLMSLTLQPELIPEEESRVLLSNLSIKTTEARTAVSSLSITEPGKYLLRVVVSSSEKERISYMGSAKIEVQ